MTPFHPDHPHYSVHKAFVEGSFANPDCPPVVQVKFNDGWDDEPSQGWFLNAQYRVKPRTITRTVTYPEPLQKMPFFDTSVWIVRSTNLPHSEHWVENRTQRSAFENGMAFATRDDAQACYDALFGGV